MHHVRSFVALLGALLLALGPGTARAAPAAPADLARARASTGDIAGALADMRAYLAAAPADAPAARALGDLAFRLGDRRAAEAAWLRVVAIDPSDGGVHLRLGALYAAEHRVLEAIRQYDVVVPSQASTVVLIRLHARYGDLDRYLAAAADAAKNRLFDADVLWRQANILQVLRHERDALDLYTRVVALRGARCDVLIGRAGDLLALHRADDAVTDIGHCLDQEPDSYDALVAMGAAEIARDRTEPARTWIERALAIDPQGVDALIDRAVVEDAAAGQAQLAMRDNRAAIGLDPTRAEAYANIAFDLLERELVPAAEAEINDGLRADPANGRLHYLRAQAYRLEAKPVSSVRAEFVAALGSDEDVVVQAANEALRSLSAKHD